MSECIHGVIREKCFLCEQEEDIAVEEVEKGFDEGRQQAFKEVLEKIGKFRDLKSKGLPLAKTHKSTLNCLIVYLKEKTDDEERNKMNPKDWENLIKKEKMKNE